MEIKNKLKILTFNVGLCLTLTEAGLNVLPIVENKVVGICNTPMEDVLKKEKLQEYKKLILEDKNLKLIFNEGEVDEIIDGNVRNIYTNVELEGNTAGTYSTTTNNIMLKMEAVDDYFDHALFHELTHALLTRDELNTGLATSLKGPILLKIFSHGGKALNEGATEYITKKLINKKAYDSRTPYGDYVNIFKTLCMTYGEEFVFKALKDDPEKLAKQLEKDGVSYNELSELLDESMKTKKYERKVETVKRAWDITRGLFIKKYSQATPEEKFEIAKRVRDIAAAQTENNMKLYGSNIHIKIGSLEGEKYLNLIEEWVNIDLYRMFISNHEIAGNISKKAELAVQSAINTTLLGTNHIPLEDIKEMRLEEVKNSNDLVIGYILKSKGKIVFTMCTTEEEYVKAYKDDHSNDLNSSTIKTLKKLEENYDIIEPIQVRELNTRTSFVLNTAEGTKFFALENSTNELSEYSVEDKFSLGDVLVEKNKDKKQNIFKKMTTKLLQVLNTKPKDTKLLTAGEHSNMAFSNNMNIGDKEFSDEKVQKISMDILEIGIEEEIKKNSDNIYGKEFREKYKVDTTELKSVEQEKQNVQNNVEEKER